MSAGKVTFACGLGPRGEMVSHRKSSKKEPEATGVPRLYSKWAGLRCGRLWEAAGTVGDQMCKNGIMYTIDNLGYKRLIYDL